MIFECKLTVDPSQLTKIEKVKPTKAFRKMVYYLTMGGVSEKEEHETYTAVSILQQINATLMASGINNIIRLSHDDIDFYFDAKGKTNDLKDAFDTYNLEINDAMSQFFNQLLLILEHQDLNFNYLIEVEISRTHAIGKYPIQITITGLLREFEMLQNNPTALKNKMSKVFNSQSDYDAFKREKKTQFEHFVGALALELKKHVKLDDITAEHRDRIIVPKEKIENKGAMPKRKTKGYHGVNYGYYGFDDYLFYSLLWSDLCHDTSIQEKDVWIEDETGALMGHKSEADTSDSFFDSETPFEEKQGEIGALIEATPDGEYIVAEMPKPELSSSGNAPDSTGGSWFDSLFDFDSSSFGDSSCSSCSSCGGCGGCGGG